MQYGIIERFNYAYREAVHDKYSFRTLDEARDHNCPELSSLGRH